MCRLAAFPPNYPRELAMAILLRFEGNNTDGVGSAYVKNDEFVVDKEPIALSELLETRDFLAHMPYNGWTIAHLRAASHGENALRNTHPFIVDDMCMVHNGVWSAYNIAALAMNKTMEGETDSEVAAHLINTVGYKKFSDAVDFGGVFLTLQRNGELAVIKASGDLELFERTDKTMLLASTLDGRKYKRAYEAEKGWYKFSKEGLLVSHEAKPVSEWEKKYASKYASQSAIYGPEYSAIRAKYGYKRSHDFSEPDDESFYQGRFHHYD